MHLTVKIIWRTKKDSQVCPKCRALEGYAWTLKIGDVYPKKLIHPVYGEVYDNRPAAECSLIKEEKGCICRCTIEHRIDLSVPRDESEPTDENKPQPDKKFVLTEIIEE